MSDKLSRLKNKNEKIKTNGCAASAAVISPPGSKGRKNAASISRM
jgi:hypothetical protein